MKAYIYKTQEELPAGQVKEIVVLAETGEDADRVARSVDETIPEALTRTILVEEASDKHRFSDSEPENVLYVLYARELPPKRTINELYAMKPKRVEFFYTHLLSSFFDDYSLDDLPDDWDADEVPKNTRVTTRILLDVCFDGERTQTLFTVWLDDTPIGVGQMAGRGGRDHSNEFVTNEAAFREAKSYLQSLLPQERYGVRVMDPDAPMRELTDFYGHDVQELDGWTG